MNIRVGAAIAVLTSLGVAVAQTDNPDQITDGEQGVEISSRQADVLTAARRALARVRGVAEVSGNRAVIFRPESGANLRYSAIKAALDAGNDSPIVGAPTLGFNLTVHVVFKSDQVSAEQMPAVIDAMPTHDTLAEITHVSGTTLRLKTAPWSPRNQRGFRVLDLVNPAARATGYRGPGAPTYDRFIEDVIFEPN